MKRTLLFFCLFIFFTFTCFSRYTPITLQEAKPTLMQVEIKGAIQNPGVYTLKRNSSISSLIQVSGGLLENSDTSRISFNYILIRRTTNTSRYWSGHCPKNHRVSQK